MGRLTVLLGGARSGKSDLAVRLAARHDGGVTFVATAQGLDDDMSARIARHRADRPAWPTVEEPLELADAIGGAPPGDMIIVDCLTLWVANAMFAGWPEAELSERGTRAIGAIRSRPGECVVVTNEVGMGVHPETELGTRYRDLLGRVNVQWAGAADLALLVVAGKAVELTDPWRFLP
jgi:adenosyl cobinamide kinase/adenosyl cobinamide phosphate guanylyltransferase